jgi:hypothetical protein
MARALVVGCLAAVFPLGACVSPLPGGTLAEPGDGSAKHAADVGGAATGGGADAGAGGSPAADYAFTFVAEPGAPRNLAADSKYLYWADHIMGAVLKVPVSGPAIPMPVSTQPVGLTWVAVDEQSVYWSLGPGSARSVARAPIDGGPEITIASSDSPVEVLAVGGGTVYWTTTAHALMKVAREGGTPIVVAEQVNPFIAVDADNVYWARAGSIMKTSTMTGESILLVAGSPTSLAVDATHLYWVAGGSVMSVSLEGGMPQQVSAGPDDDAMNVAADASGVYWTTTRGYIFRGEWWGNSRPVGGAGTPGYLAYGTALDATSIYWMTIGPRAIFKAPK